MSAGTTIPTSATPDVVTAAILVDGTQIPGTLEVISVTVTREVNRIPTAVVHIKDGEASQQTFAASNMELFVPGKEVEIQLGYRSQNDSVFKGIVIRHGLKARQSGSMLIVECKDKAVKLTQHQRSAYYLDKRDSEIIEDIIDSHGLTSDVEAIDVDVKAIVQYDATDWDFVLCRAEANGRLVVVHDGTINVKSPDASTAPPVSVAFGATLIELDIETDARLQNESITAQSWSGADQTITQSEAQEPSIAENGNIAPYALAQVAGTGQHVYKHGAPLSEPELKAWADSKLLTERFGRARGRAVFQGFPSLLPGNTIQVDGIGERFEGKHLVSGVRHTFINGQWQTHAQLGLDPVPFMQKFPINTPPAGGLLPAVPGLQIGIVTALEGDPDGEHRVRVKLPLVSTSDDGVWARLATLDAGNERGTYFRPEIDDEVIVGFIHDDPRFAVILGQLHSSAKPTPEPLADNNHKKGYVSREKLKLEFDDEKKILHMETPAGNMITLTEKDTAIKIEDQNGNKLEMNPDGITIESIADITLKATANIKLEGVNIEIAASAGFKAEGSATSVISGASTTVKGSGTLTIQGALVKIN